MGSMVRAYAIRAEGIASERDRVAGDMNQFDIARVIELSDLELRSMGPRDVHMRILAVSAEHNVSYNFV